MQLNKSGIALESITSYNPRPRKCPVEIEIEEKGQTCRLGNWDRSFPLPDLHSM